MYPFDLNYVKYLEGVIRFASLDDGNSINREEESRTSIGVNYFLIEHVMIKFEYEFDNELGQELYGKSFVQAIFKW